MRYREKGMRWVRKFSQWYTRFFSVDEVERSPTLHLAAGALLLGWFLEFQNWSRLPDLTTNAVRDGLHLCWPWFQSCGDWYFLTTGSLGYSQSLFYTALLGLMFFAALALAYRRFSVMHALFLVFITWEVTAMLLSYRVALNYWYIHALFAFIFLFASKRLVFLRIMAVLFYFLSGVIKLNSSWLQGGYFKALSSGLYLFPDTFIPIATNAVVLMELTLVWFLFSPRREIRLSVLALLFIFHVYSAMYVGFTYPTVVFPMVLILFLSREESPVSFRFFKKHVVGTLVLLGFIGVHFVPLAIHGDVRITLEGNKFGNYMFRANYQCESRADVIYKDGTIEPRESNSFYAVYRCNPYGHFFYFKQICTRDDSIDRIRWTFDTSVDGSPLMRIVDVEDACTLAYKPFSHNEWIRLPEEDDIQIVGVPAKNRYLVSDPAWQTAETPIQ